MRVCACTRIHTSLLFERLDLALQLGILVHFALNLEPEALLALLLQLQLGTHTLSSALLGYIWLFDGSDRAQFCVVCGPTCVCVTFV